MLSNAVRQSPSGRILPSSGAQDTRLIAHVIDLISGTVANTGTALITSANGTLIDAHEFEVSPNKDVSLDIETILPPNGTASFGATVAYSMMVDGAWVPGGDFKVAATDDAPIHRNKRVVAAADIGNSSRLRLSFYAGWNGFATASPGTSVNVDSGTVALVHTQGGLVACTVYQEN